jgi:hypothetical protein
MCHHQTARFVGENLRLELAASSAGVNALIKLCPRDFGPATDMGTGTDKHGNGDQHGHRDGDRDWRCADARCELFRPDQDLRSPPIQRVEHQSGSVPFEIVKREPHAIGIDFDAAVVEESEVV